MHVMESITLVSGPQSARGESIRDSRGGCGHHGRGWAHRQKKYRLAPPNGARLLVLSYRCRGPRQSVDETSRWNIATARSRSRGPQLA